MLINMQDDNIVAKEQLKEFAKLNDAGTKFTAKNKVERNKRIENVLAKFRYFSCRKKEKTIVKKYIARMTGFQKTTVSKHQ